MDDETLWKRRFLLFAAVRLAGLAIFLLGIAIAYTGLLREGGWPAVGGVVVALGLVDAVLAPRILRRQWQREDTP